MFTLSRSRRLKHTPFTKNFLNKIHAKATWTVLLDRSFAMGTLQ